MAANIKIKKIVKNSKMKLFQWKWIFRGSKTCCTIWRPFLFAMVAILNPKWPPKYKDPPIWTKFGFQVDYDVANWYPSLVYYGGHFVSKMAAKIQNRPIGTKFGFQVDYDVANWYPNFTGMLSTMRCADYFRNFQNGRRSHGNHKRTRTI